MNSDDDEKNLGVQVKPCSDQPSDGGYRSFVDLGFKVAPWFKRRYAIEAAFRGLSKKDLMLACFQAFLDANGGTMEKAKADSMVGD